MLVHSPRCLEPQFQLIFKCPGDSSASLAKGAIILKRDLSEHHYATHGILVETHAVMFSFLYFVVKLHPGSHNSVAVPHLHTNAGSATFAV